MFRRAAVGGVCLLICAAMTHANPIPWPPPASMPLELMWIDIDRVGEGYRADFEGHFTFDYIPGDVQSMMFPIPDGSWGERVCGPPGSDREFTWATEMYPTVLPEMPSIRMVQWQGPFAAEGEVFSVEYQHELIQRPGEHVLFYSLGTGKYFPTYDKITRAQFIISLPPSLAVQKVMLDRTAVDRSTYFIHESVMSMVLDSQFGPFTKDLIITLTPAVAGDFDRDADVDLDDFAVLKSYFGSTSWATTYTGDCDGDEDVDLDDFVILKRNFGAATPSTGSGQAVPEPTTLLLMTAAGLRLL